MWDKQQAMTFFSEILYPGDICRAQKLFSEHAEFNFLLIPRMYIRIKVYYVGWWKGPAFAIYEANFLLSSWEHDSSGRS